MVRSSGITSSLSVQAADALELFAKLGGEHDRDSLSAVVLRSSKMIMETYEHAKTYIAAELRYVIELALDELCFMKGLMLDELLYVIELILVELHYMIKLTLDEGQRAAKQTS